MGDFSCICPLPSRLNTGDPLALLLRETQVAICHMESENAIATLAKGHGDGI